MKKKMRNLFSILLVLLMTAQLPGLSAGAAGPVSGDESLSYVLYTTPDPDGVEESVAKPELVPGEDEAERLNGTCEVRFGDTPLTRGSGGVQLKTLLDKEKELTVAPPEGTYVKALYFCGDDPETGAGKDLLPFAEAALDSTKISIPGETFFDEADDSAFHAALLPQAPASDGGYKLYIQVEKIGTAPVTVRYDLGKDAPSGDGAPSSQQAGDDGTVTAAQLSPELRSAAVAAHKEFTGWSFTYSNGSTANVEENTPFKPYEDVVLTAQWAEKACAEFTVGDLEIVYGDTPSPHMDSFVQGYHADVGGVTFLYLNDEEEPQSGRLPAGTYTITVSGLSVTDEDGEPTEDYSVKEGRLTVKRRPVSVSVNSPVDGKSVSYQEDGLLPNDRMDHVSISVEKIDGQYVAKASGAVIYDINGEDVTANYEITYIDGYASIPAPPSPTAPVPQSRGKLTIQAQDRKTEYTGAFVTANDYLIPSGAMTAGDKIVKVTYEGGSTNVTQDGGVSCYPDDVLIEDSYGNDVTGEYDITLLPGTVTVTARKMTVTAKDVVKDYDGEKFSLSAANLDITGKVNSSEAKHEVRVGFQIMQNGKKTSAVKAGTYTIDITSVQVVDEDGDDVSGNYSITMNDGKLTINGTEPSPSPTPSPTPSPAWTASPATGGAIKLTVTADSGVWQYDGSAHTVDTYKVTGLQPGDRITSVTFANNSNTITDAGTQSSTISSVSIVDSKNASANYKYNITLVPGTLTVSKAPLTLTAESASKDYDGKELENKNVSVSKLANEEHKLSVRFNVVDENGNTTKAIEPGTYTKEITSYTITDGKEDVSQNYDVKLVDGTLTVLSAGSSVEPEGQDGTRHGAGLGVWLSILLGSALILGGGTAALYYFYTKKKKAGADPRTGDSEVNLFESIFKKKK